MSFVTRDGLFAKYEFDFKYFSIFLFIVTGRILSIRWWGI